MLGLRACFSGQRGIALLTVLLVVFLASLTAVALASLQQIAIRRSAVLLHQQQAKLYTLGAEQWAIAILQRDRKASETDHFDESWASLPAVLTVANGKLSNKLYDLQGRFNLNSLIHIDSETDTVSVDQQQLKLLQGLLEKLDLDPGIAQAIADWIDPDQEILFPDGAEDGDYMGYSPAYLTANQAFQSVTELRLIKGVDKAIYDDLAPYVSALPETEPLNINTAPDVVLAALTEQAAANVGSISQRRREPYDSVESFLQDTGLTEAEISPAKLSVSSRYFMLSAQAEVGDSRAMLSSVLYRPDNGRIRVVMRSFGAESFSTYK